MACTINDKFGHNFAGGICQVCKKLQRAPMKKFTVNPFANYRFKKMSSDSGSQESSNSKIQLSTDLINFYKEGSYGFYMKIIKIAGEDIVRGWMSDSKLSEIPIKRFKWLWSEYYKKINWTNK